MQLILRQPGEPPVKILSREEVTQGDALLVVLYGITLVPIAEELRAADPGFLSSLYADDAAFNSLAQQSAHLLNIFMKWRLYRGYLPEPAKFLLILDTLGQEEAARREFAAEEIVLNFGSDSRYLGDYLGPQEGLEARVKPQMKAWSHEVIVLVKIAQRHPQTAFSGLGMSLQLEWQYLQKTSPRFRTLMSPI